MISSGLQPNNKKTGKVVITLSSISGHIHVSRQTVKRYSMGDFIPGQRKVSARQSAVMAQEVPAFIQACLETYLLGNLLQQKHTANDSSFQI